MYNINDCVVLTNDEIVYIKEIKEDGYKAEKVDISIDGEITREVMDIKSNEIKGGLPF